MMGGKQPGDGCMMQVTSFPHKDVPVFRAYDDDFLQLGEQRLTSSLVIHKHQVLAPWTTKHLRALIADDFSFLQKQAPPEILLIGTGRITAFPDTSIMQWLEDAHISFECMDTRAAARTYNILVAEDREVSAAMLLPKD